MPGYTAPNQRTIQVHRERPNGDFLGIKNANWMYASKDLGAHALRLYLYLASNADGYELALSPAAITDAIGMPRSTYHDQFKILVDKGYLIETSSNHYSFYEKPKNRMSYDGCENISDTQTCTKAAMAKPQEKQENPSIITEIYNNVEKIDFINNGINSEGFIPKEEKRGMNKYINEKGEFIF